eukprot:CAMPEP_0116090014 /NCGR_PEP_ID=MMETSP0327-20121206/6730_1 /TAXON_ID=44447 /ORGANISM="Pseudo-nitzschia delicatissima, Strain B596" /LENGTH=562 /DNA_ID=CAMNT_0003581239 /DNA_START=235 /DNA_END=1923 /DNA_ORIENTATION=-
MPKSNGNKKKKNVKEIDGVLWLLDDNGNRIKKVKKKAKPGSENDLSRNPSNHSGSNEGKKKRPNVKEIDGCLYQVDEDGTPIKKVRRKGSPRENAMNDKRRRASSTGPVPGRRRPREQIEPGSQRLRSSSLGRTRHKPGEYIDAKGRRVVIDDEGNKTVYDKKGRKLRPKRKPQGMLESMHGSMPAKVSLHSSSSRPETYDRRQDLLKSSIYESGRFDALWSDSPKKSFKGSLGALQEDSQRSFNHNDLKDSTKDLMMNGGSISNLNGASSSQIAELSQQVTNYGHENRSLKTQLMALDDKVRTLTQQNQKEKSKNVKATTEMLQLKADYQQASDEKRNLELQIKNLEARYREKEEELEKLESTPANRRISMPAASSGKSDHLVTQINDLMAENDALLTKLDLAKASSGHDVKKKEEQILFLNQELMKLREENDMLFRGEAEKDPLMARLFKQKKDIEEKLNQEREKSAIRMDSMQETVDSLEASNATLKKELEKVTLEINDDDDEDVRRAKEMAQAVANRGTGGNARQIKRATSKAQIGVQNQRRSSGFWGLRDMGDQIGR